MIPTMPLSTVHTFFISLFVSSHLSTIVIQQVAGHAYIPLGRQLWLNGAHSHSAEHQRDLKNRKSVPACQHVPKGQTGILIRVGQLLARAHTGHPPSSISAQTSACTSASTSVGVDTVSRDSATSAKKNLLTTALQCLIMPYWLSKV